MVTTKSRTSTKAAKNSPDVPTRHLPNKTFVIDNGAYTMKAGYACDPSSSTEEALSNCTSIPNAIVKTRDNRIWTGTQLASHVTDWNEAVFRRPVEKGYIVNWEAEREIWDQTFFEEKATARNKQLRIAHPEETTLVLTEAPNNMPVLQRNTDEMVMEEWGFGGYVRCLGKRLKCQFYDICAIGDTDLNLSFKALLSMLGTRSTCYSVTLPPLISCPRTACWLSIRDTHIQR
jgi:actin-related protein 6